MLFKNLEILNLVILLVLGITSILGFLGIKDINSLKKEYKNELEELKKLKSGYLIKNREFTLEKRSVNKKIKEVQKFNEKQNDRIQLLELQEKIDSLVKSKAYQHALSYALRGLEMDSNNLVLLHQTAQIYWKLNNLLEATNTYRRILELEQSNESVIKNLCELYLLQKNINQYDDLIKKYSNIFNNKRSSVDLIYLELLKQYKNNDFETMEKFFNEYLNSEENFIKKRTNWDFEELLLLLR